MRARYCDLQLHIGAMLPHSETYSRPKTLMPKQ